MNYLLDGEEVLSFGLDDYVHDKVNQITVQSKSLCIYIVDFELGRVIKKIDKYVYGIIPRLCAIDQ